MQMHCCCCCCLHREQITDSRFGNTTLQQGHSTVSINDGSCTTTPFQSHSCSWVRWGVAEHAKKNCIFSTCCCRARKRMRNFRTVTFVRTSAAGAGARTEKLENDCNAGCRRNGRVAVLFAPIWCIFTFISFAYVFVGDPLRRGDPLRLGKFYWRISKGERGRKMHCNSPGPHGSRSADEGKSVIEFWGKLGMFTLCLQAYSTNDCGGLFIGG